MGTAVALIYPTHGHIAPVLGVVEELVRRGERVIFYATGRSRSKIESTGAEFREYAVGHDAFSPNPPTDGLFSDMARLSALTEELLPALSEQVRRDNPDYMLVDSKSLWGRLVGQVLDTPAVTLSVVFAIQRGVIGVPDLVNGLYGGAPREKMLTGLTALSQYLQTSRRLQSRHETISPGIVEYLGNPQPLNIIFTSREFQLQGESFGDEFQFVGPSISSKRDASVDLPFKIAEDRPVVYISLGTTFNNAPEFYRACFEAFANEPWQVILSTGKDGLMNLPEPPENFIVREFVPQLKVLEHTDLFITHGGMNSANEGLYHGIPLVVVPQRGDQYLVGARVAELGAGLCIPPQNVTPQGLREAASDALSNPQFRHRALSLGKTLRDAGGYVRAADSILSFAAKVASSPSQAQEGALPKSLEGLAAPVSSDAKTNRRNGSETRKAIVTGSGGLIGSQCVRALCAEGWEVIGIDNDLRAWFFGENGTTKPSVDELIDGYPSYRHENLDIRDRQAVRDLFRSERPAFIIHTAAQPSHDKAASIPYDDFDVNAVGTLNLLAAARDFARESPFCFLSTNKVYGDRPNHLPLIEKETRWDYAGGLDGIAEDMSVDQCLHSLFGASKLAADVLCQEYGRYFQMPVGIFRGGCLTGPNHAGVELHGYLNYIVRCAVLEQPYTIYGYKGKQVRDQIHAHDVAQLLLAFHRRPRRGEVYNLGGGRANSLSILETIEMLKQLGYRLSYDYVDEPRTGDHICYISDLGKVRRDFPEWRPAYDLPKIFTEIVEHIHEHVAAVV